MNDVSVWSVNVMSGYGGRSGEDVKNVVSICGPGTRGLALDISEAVGDFCQSVWTDELLHRSHRRIR